MRRQELPVSSGQELMDVLQQAPGQRLRGYLTEPHPHHGEEVHRGTFTLTEGAVQFDSRQTGPTTIFPDTQATPGILGAVYVRTREANQEPDRRRSFSAWFRGVLSDNSGSDQG